MTKQRWNLAIEGAIDGATGALVTLQVSAIAGTDGTVSLPLVQRLGLAVLVGAITGAARAWRNAKATT